ncbi:MAG: M28 family peptidase [Saprospiraceae bacterium]|nr:M28 family peptidase [Saprospiraceae bacterium]
MKSIVGLFLLLTSALMAQYHDVSEQLARSIESKSLKEHVYTLASTEYQGRETGKEGNKKAAEYIAGQLASYGIPPIPGDTDHFQEVGFTTFKWENIQLTVSGEAVEHLKEYIAIPQHFPVQPGPIDINSLMFLGYGIDDEAYSDYEGVDVRGKHLLVYAGEPRDQNDNFRLTGSDSISEWSSDPYYKIDAAKKAGAASLWIIENDFRQMVMYARRELLTGATLMETPEQLNNYLPLVSVSPTLGQKLAGKKVNKIIKLRDKITRKGRPTHTTIPVDVHFKAAHQIKSTPSVNVLGYIEGLDPVLKQEVVIVSAHFDHLGMRGTDIFFGADDNASGTSAVLEIAQAFAAAKAAGQGPKRSVLCMLITGEEKGLLGSQYYAEHPIFPLEQTVADVNIDMIGRVDDQHVDSNYTYVIGADRLSTELHDINETANSKYTKLQLDYTFNRDDDPNRFYYRSDHYNFAKNGIPVIFYFSGVHADYHRPTDTPDKIMYGKAETIARLAFHTTWELANRDERIKVNVTGRN